MSEARLKKTKRMTFGEQIKDLRVNKYLVLMTLPGILFFIIFSYIPMAGLIIAFQDFNAAKGILGSRFVGLENFRFFFGSQDMVRVTANTLYLNLLFIVSGMVCSILIAIMLSEISAKTFKKVAQSLVILPHFMSWSVVALISVALFSTEEGMINQVLAACGGEPINFYRTPEIWPLVLVCLKIWQGAGFGSIVYLAAITGIDQEIYEAARIDGAGRLKCIFCITLPMLKNIALLMFIMSVGKIFYGDFGMIYAMVGNNATLYPTTDVIDTYVYRQLMELGDMGMASAVGLYQSLVGFLFVIGTNAIARKFAPESAIF